MMLLTMMMILAIMTILMMTFLTMMSGASECHLVQELHLVHCPTPPPWQLHVFGLNTLIIVHINRKLTSEQYCNIKPPVTAMCELVLTDFWQMALH